jgi:hypothetical protein
MADPDRVNAILGIDVPQDDDAAAHASARADRNRAQQAVDDVGTSPTGPRDGMEVLGREECLELLRAVPIGRLAVTCGALPVVLPISFRLAGEQIFFQVVRGSSLDMATRDAVVAFEADDVDRTTLAGWSVLVVGVAEDALESDCPGDLAAAGVPWAAPGSDHRIVALSTTVVSGRRITVGNNRHLGPVV